MTNKDRRIDSMLFNYETSMLTEYQTSPLQPHVSTIYREPKRSCLTTRPLPLKDLHTLTDWREHSVPFTLFWKKKGVVDTDPRDMQKPFMCDSSDPEKREARKTRPRLVMTPAESIDDMPEEQYDILVNDMYTSTTCKALKETIQISTSHRKCIKTDLPKKHAPTNVFMLRKLDMPYVSPEWRMPSVSWDTRQLRSYTQPTEKFWSNRSK